MRAIAAALFLLQAQAIHARFGADLAQTPAILSGARAPHLRLNSPWEAIRRVPDEVPVLTEALYVAQLANRPVIYAADDFRTKAGQLRVLSAVDWVLLRKEHEWKGLLEREGFRAVAEGGNVRVYRREEARGKGMNPILPE